MLYKFSCAQVFETGVSEDVCCNRGLINTNDGGYILFSGQSPYFSSPKQIIKFDSTGNVVWARKYSNGFDCGTKLGQNHFAIYGTRDSSAWPGPIFYNEFSVFDSAGFLVSAFTIPESLIVNNIHPTFDGGTISNLNDPGWAISSLIIKTDLTGNFEWGKYIDSIGGSSHTIWLSDIIQKNGGGYLGIAEYTAPDTNSAPHYNLLIRLNSVGDTIWTKSFNRFLSWPFKVFNAKDEGFLVADKSKFIMFDSTGNVKWAQEFLDPSYMITGCVISTDSNFIFSGSKFDSLTLPFILKVDTNGAIQWMRKYYSASFSESPNLTYCLANTTDNGYVLTGNVDTSYLYQSLIKTDSLGISICDSAGQFPILNLQQIQSTPVYHAIHPVNYTKAIYPSTAYPTFIDSVFTQTNYCIITSLPNVNLISDIQIFPNPSSGKFTISDLISNNWNLSIFNIMGEKIFTRKFIGNRQDIILPMNPGIYFVYITDGEKKFGKKIIIE